MEKKRTFIEEPLEVNVLVAAKERIRWCFKTFDEVVLNFSGGKDSMVLALLTQEVMEELGIPQVKAVFYSEEIVFPEIEEVVERLFSFPWIDGYHLCPRMLCELTLPDGEIKRFRSWEDGREHFRPLPKRAILLSEEYTMYDMEQAVREHVVKNKGKTVVQLLGVRAQESSSRRATILQGYQRGAFCFLLNSSAIGTRLAEPIYDWKTEDVFKFLQGKRSVLPLSDSYRAAMLTKRPLRASMPLHGAQTRNLASLKQQSPLFYEKLVAFLPEVGLVSGYTKDAVHSGDYDSLIAPFGGLTIRGMKKYIVAKVKPEEKIFALNMLKQFMRDYIEFDRYAKYGHTRESALKVCFREIVKRHYVKTIMLGNKATSKKGKIELPS